MPVRLVENGRDDQVCLDRWKRLRDEFGATFYLLSDASNQGIRVHHLPDFVSNWDANRFELLVFQNPYLNAENDVFEVYLQELADERAGWMFPIRLLDSNDSDFVGQKNLDHYRSIAYEKLFHLDCSVDAVYYTERTYGMRELYGDVVLLVLSMDALSRVTGFNLDDYLLSLFQYGYVRRNGKSIVERKHSGSLLRNKMARRTRLTIRRSMYSLVNDSYTKALVEDGLLKSSDSVVRFILLYQIVEHLIARRSESHFNDLLASYTSGGRSRNNLREALLEMRERDILRLLFTGWELDSELRNDFADRCELLLNGHAKLKSRDVHDCIYDVRNLLTHNLRSVIGRKNEIDEVVERFEGILMQFLVERAT